MGFIKFTPEKTIIIPYRKGKIVFKKNQTTMIWDGRATSDKIWRAFRKIIIKRDGEEGNKCGRGENLQVHHINPMKKSPNQYLDKENVITLCKPCHKEEHANIRRYA